MSPPGQQSLHISQVGVPARSPSSLSFDTDLLDPSVFVDILDHIVLWPLRKKIILLRIIDNESMTSFSDANRTMLDWVLLSERAEAAQHRVGGPQCLAPPLNAICMVAAHCL